MGKKLIRGGIVEALRELSHTGIPKLAVGVVFEEEGAEGEYAVGKPYGALVRWVSPSECFGRICNVYEGDVGVIKR